MNDPVLNRKLFRHKAQIIHNKIPKYQTGGPPQSPFTAGGFQQATGSALARRSFLKDLGWLASPGKYFKGAKYAYQTYKTARAASKASSKPATWKSMLPFTKTTGPRSVWQTLKHKYPKTTGGITAGVGGSFAYSGQKTAREGYKEKDYGKMALGIGEMGIGVPWASKAIQAMRIKGVSGKAAKVSKVARGKSWKDPRTWGPFGLIAGGALTARDAEAEPGITFTESQSEEIYQILKTVAKDIENYTEEELNKAVEIYKKQKYKSDDTKPDNLGDTGTNEMKADEVPPGTGSPVTVDEAKILSQQKDKNAETQANVLKNKFDNSDMQTQREFLKFRQAITDLTGTYGNDRDLILMKMASGMMTGKTSQTGLKGFMDVTGQAMGPTVDTALALSNAQKGRDTDLATAFLKMKQEQAEAAEGGGMVLKGAQKRFLVKDPASPYGYKVVTGQYNDQTGQIMEHLGNQEYRVMQGDPTEIKVSMAQLGKTQTQLGSAAMGLDYVNWVLNDMDDSLKGLKGWAKLKLADWQNLAETYEGKSNKYTQGLNTSDYVDGLLTPENIEGYNDKVEIKDWKGKVIRESTVGQEIRKQYVEEQSEIRENMAKRTSGWDINEEQLFQLTKAALIENRLKYIIANANKSEDRLTRWDIDNAAKNTGILPFITFSQGFTPETVNAKMKVLQGELIGNFNSQARKYQQQGGTNDFLLDFTSVPYIQQFLEDKQAAEMDQQAFFEGLESIELPGVGG